MFFIIDISNSLDISNSYYSQAIEQQDSPDVRKKFNVYKPIKNLIDYSQVICSYKCPNLEETTQEHTKAHLMTSSIVYPGWVSKAFSQVLLYLWYGSVKLQWQGFLQQLQGTL